MCYPSVRSQDAFVYLNSEPFRPRTLPPHKYKLINIYRLAYRDLTMADAEHVEQFFPGIEYPIISYGLPFSQACAKHAKQTLGCSKVFVICSGSLSRNTDVLERLEAALGKDHLVGVRKGMKPHTMFSELLNVAVEVEKSGADCIVTVGGGSLVDAAKYIPFISALSGSFLAQKL